MNCLHKRNPSGGFVGQHKRFCGHHQCDSDAVNHVMVGNHWCANLCNTHTKYYRSRKDAEVTAGLSVIVEEKTTTAKGTKR